MPERDPVTHEIIGAAIAVSKAMGNALLESVYQICLAHEIAKRGLAVERQRLFPVVYDGIHMELGFRADLVVAHEVIVEIKAVSVLLPAHDAQILTYMKLSGVNKGLLINFHAYPFTKGIKRFVL